MIFSKRTKKIKIYNSEFYLSETFNGLASQQSPDSTGFMSSPVAESNNVSSRDAAFRALFEQSPDAEEMKTKQQALTELCAENFIQRFVDDKLFMHPPNFR